jgi:signal transduction histidine kinase
MFRLHPVTFLTLGYSITAALWIAFSDRVLESLASDVNLLSSLQTFKGLFFVSTTGLLLYFFARREFNKQERAADEIRSLNAVLEKRVEERTAKLTTLNADLEAFSYTVSHDLRAPLRAISGYTHMLLDTESCTDEGYTYANNTLNAVKRMDTLIEDLLAYSRIGRGELHCRNVALQEIVREALQNLELQIQESSAKIDVREPLLSVSAHYATLRQVVTNLLTNALKFKKPDAAPCIVIRSERRENFVRLWIEDNGIGIDPQYHERIFRVFERLETGYTGTGIGLAIVSKGVERMGGRVGVESQEGQGSHFWIELPATSA